MDLAPIVLFVYNRPWHTEQTLNALAKNKLANESILYIYADGAKANATKEDLEKIEKIRTLIKSKKWCKEIHIIESEKNKGLADSIVEGVTEIINKFEKVIVLEDDLITSKFFLQFMNDALNIYADSEKVMHVSGYMFPHNNQSDEKSFFCQIALSWGWATWKRAWIHYQNEGVKIKQKLLNKKLLSHFNMDGTYSYERQLDANINGTLKTWAVFWHASIILNGGMALNPLYSLVNNIGHDGSGENCGNDENYTKQYLYTKPIALKVNQNITESIFGREIIKNYHLTISKLIPIFIKENYFKKLYSRIKLLFRSFLFQIRDENASIKTIIKKIVKKILGMKSAEVISHSYTASSVELKSIGESLLKIPRYQYGKISFCGHKLSFIDAASTKFIINELFEKEIYKFTSKKKSPYIIDCGANIGLGIIYFKQLFPDAEIVAFEPNAQVFKTLQDNIDSFALHNVKLIQKALWGKGTQINFLSEGADAGRVSNKGDSEEMISANTTRLASYLDRPVDFLKIDIEGAETRVLKDCVDLLKNIERIFVEYHSFENQQQDLQGLLEILTTGGFRYNMGIFSSTPFIKINSSFSMDNQLNIFAYRINN